MDFGKYIKELLLQHDCVILPGLGGFVANYRPAVFDTGRRTVSPPSKHILFNGNLVHNDGLLYGYASQASGLGYKDVQERAQAYIERIRKDVRRGLKFTIEGLGYFFADGENRIQFSEEAGNNFLLESYGLPYLEYREFEKYPKADAYRAYSTEADPLARQRRIRRWAYAAAAACLLAALIVVPVRYGYFNRAGIEVPAADGLRKEQTVSSGDAGRPLRDVAYGTTGAQAMKKACMPDPEYNIVVGSFRDFGNARQLRNRLVEEGYNARILCSGEGYFRVTAGTYSLQDEAAEMLTSVRDRFENAWILNT